MKNVGNTKRRPALIIQTDAANANPRYPNTIVLTLSRTGHPITSHIEVQPSPANGLRDPSYVKCEQILTVSKERLESQIGTQQPQIWSA